MSKKPDYERATNAAYEFLISQSADFPFVDVFKLVMSLPYVKLHTYSECAKICHVSHKDFTKNFASSEHGFTITDGNKSIICYNELKDEKTIRFTIPHELGHTILKHQDDDPIANKEADCFARNLLCPVPIIDKYGLRTKADYIYYFGISEVMTEPALAYYKSDKYYISDDNYTKIWNTFDERIKKESYAEWNEHMAIARESFFSSEDDSTLSYIAI